MNRLLRFGLLTIALALSSPLRADDKATPPPPADDQASLKADNKQLSDELAAAWKESADLKTKVDQLGADNAALNQKLDAAKADAAAKPDAPAPVPAPASSDSSQQLADVQEKLATALRSFSVLQDENADLKSQLDKITSDNATFSQQLDAARASNATLQVQAAATSQIDPLRNEVRQAQDEIGRLASENEQLRNRLAIQSPGPGAARPMPQRPSQVSAPSAPAAPAPAAAPAARTYVVAEGDTLTKISRKFYGNSGRWEEILKANHDILKDEKSLVVGSTLKIP
jgi:regulator of replication initiation timing